MLPLQRKMHLGGACEVPPVERDIFVGTRPLSVEGPAGRGHPYSWLAEASAVSWSVCVHQTLKIPEKGERWTWNPRFWFQSGPSPPFHPPPHSLMCDSGKVTCPLWASVFSCSRGELNQVISFLRVGETENLDLGGNHQREASIVPGLLPRARGSKGLSQPKGHQLVCL